MKPLLKAKLLEMAPDVMRTGDRTLNLRTHRDSLYVGRGSPWGNPHVIPANDKWNDEVREQVVQKYLRDVMNMESEDRVEWLMPVFHALRQNRKLRCFCAPKLCHAHALARWVRHHAEFADHWRILESVERLGSS